MRQLPKDEELTRQFKASKGCFVEDENGAWVFRCPDSERFPNCFDPPKPPPYVLTEK